MKKALLLASLTLGSIFANAQAQGLEGIVVEKYYKTDALDSTNAADNGSSTVLRAGSIAYRVFVDMAPGYKFIQMFGSSDLSNNPVHPWVIKTTTDFFNDPNNGQVFPQSNSLNNTKKHLTLIDSYLAAGGVCAGKMGVVKTDDTDGSIGNSNGVLTNNPGGIFGVAINSIVAGAQDGLMPGSPISPNALGLGTQTDIFDQTAGSTFSVINGAVAALGGAVGTTTSNMILIGQFTTSGILTFTFNVQISNTLTNVAEIYVPTAITTSETSFPALIYTSATTNTTTDVSIKENKLGSVNMLEIVPNPVTDNATLRFTSKLNETITLSVIGQDGAELLSSTFEAVAGQNTVDIDLSTLRTGIYFLSLNSSGTYICKKITKQ